MKKIKADPVTKRNVKKTKKKVKTENGLEVTGAKKRPSKKDLKAVISAMKKDDVSLIHVRLALKYLPHYLKSVGLTKKLLKEVINLWSTGSEKIRVVSLLCLIRTYTKLKDKQLKEVVVKKLYSTFLKKCRVTKDETMSMIGFMRHSIIELYKLDSKIAYKQAQSIVQQLELTLKSAKNHTNEETIKSALNWQSCNCLILLSSLITSFDHLNDNDQIRSLNLPVIQLNIDAIELITSPRYYGFQLHVIENLVKISIHTNLYIPVLPMLVNLVLKIDIPRDEVEAAKEYNMDLLNHVSHEESSNPSYKEAVLNKCYELMVRYLASQSHRIAFPELALLPSVQVKKWFKNNHGPKTQKFKILLEKIKTDSQTIEEQRKNVDFAFNNYAAVDAWEKKLSDSNKLVLPKLVSTLNTPA